MVQEIKTVQEFSDAIDTSDTDLIIIDFYTDWCGPCKTMAPKFATMAKKYPNVGFYKINTDNPAFTELCDVCEIRVLPSFCLFYEGKYINKITGSDDKYIEKILADTLDKITERSPNNDVATLQFPSQEQPRSAPLGAPLRATKNKTKSKSKSNCDT